MKETIIERLSWWSTSRHVTPAVRLKWKTALKALEAGDNYPVLGLIQLELQSLREPLVDSGAFQENELPGLVEMRAMIQWLKDMLPKRRCPGLFRFKNQVCLMCPRPKSWHQTNHARR